MFMHFRSHQSVTLVSLGALALAACSSNGAYRVGSVGTVPSDIAGDNGSTAGGGNDVASGVGGSSGVGTGMDGNAGGGSSNGGAMAGGGSANGGGATNGGGAGSGSGGNTATASSLGGRVLVSAGNAVIGTAARVDPLTGRVNSLVPGTASVNATVTAVLRRSGQTLVDLGGGRSAVLNSARGRLGEVVGIDLAGRKVVSGASGSSLLGVSVLAPNAAAGTLASLGVANGSGGLASATVAPLPAVVNSALSVVGTVTQTASAVTGRVGGGSAVGGSVLAPVGAVLGAAAPAGVLGTVTNVATGAVGAIAAPTTPTNVLAPVTQTAGNLGAGVTGALGVRTDTSGAGVDGALRIKRK